VAKNTGTILVLGAGGRLGFTAAEAFRDAGWTVKGLVRPKKSAFVPKGVAPVEAVTREEAIEAAKGCDVVLNAFNPVITEWQRSALSLAYAAIAAAEANGATLMFPGSVWNFGEGMPAVIDETTLQNATTRKGQMRVEMEQRIREACDRGMRAIILRAGDYFGAGRGSWFDLVITKEMNRSRLTYPGPSDVVHEWTYLPDFADTLVKLAERRAEFAAFESFGFSGHAITGAGLVKAIEAETKKIYNVRRMSWWMLKTIGQLSAVGRELSELEYLWRVPHQIAGDKLKGVLGDVPHTPLDRAVGRSLRALGLT
jgi:nucleoside-diphosphate-sugar epimerase